MASNATFYRQKFSDMQKHDQGMTDDLRKSELERYDKAIQAIQANPGIPDDQKNLAITKIRQQGINIMTPSLGKKRVAQLKQQFGIPDVPVNTPAEFQAPAMSAPPLQAPVSTGDAAPAATMDADGNATSVTPVAPIAPVQLPDRPASNYAVKPIDTTEALSMATKSYNPFTLYKKQLMESGMSEEDADRAVQVKAQLQAAAKQEHPTDFGRQEESYAKSLGKTRAELTPEEHFAFNKQYAQSRKVVIPKLGDLNDFIQRAARDAEVDPKDITAEQITQLTKAFKSGSQLERVSHGLYQYTDATTGNIVSVPITRRSGPVQAQMPTLNAAQPRVAPAPAPTKAPAVAPIMVNPEPGQPPLVPPVRPAAPARPQATAPAPQAAPVTPAAIKASVNAAAPQSLTPAAGAPVRGSVIGHTASMTDKAALKGATKQIDTVTPMVNIDQTMSQYVRGGQFSPRQDLALIVSAVRAMNPGTVRLPQKELDLELHAGSWGDRWRRLLDNASKGLLPNDQRLDLLRVIHNETAHAAKNAATAWQQQNPTAPIPFQLQGYLNEAGDPNEKVPVMVDGKPYTMTREGIERATADGHKVVRQIGQ